MATPTPAGNPETWATILPFRPRCPGRASHPSLQPPVDRSPTVSEHRFVALHAVPTQLSLFDVDALASTTTEEVPTT